MLLIGNNFYVANTDGVLRYSYQPGATKITGDGQRILGLPKGGYNNHWTRNLLASPDGTTIYVTVGSGSNVQENGAEQEVRRANILQINPDGSGEKGLTKIRLFIEGMLHDSELNGPQLYFGDYSYLADDQRAQVKAWADRLTLTLERFLDEGIADGSVVPCEPKIVVELLLGMLIWLAKWVPSIEGMTFERLMDAINLVSLAGLKSGV